MSRTNRIIKEKGYIHLITRGNGKQLIFEDDQDRWYYLKLLRKYSQEQNIIISAYCLMDNHVHLLAYYENNTLACFMKKMGVAYSNYFNKKYDRTGHLFQDRFKSELIYNENHLLIVTRYILNNPVKAGICNMDEFQWSSYHLDWSQNDFVDASFAIELCGGIENYLVFLSEKNNDECMEYTSKARDDVWAKGVMLSVLDIKSGNELRNLDKIARDEALAKLKNNGISITQISRLTGIGRNIVQRACKK